MTFISAQRGISSRARASAMGRVELEMAKLEAEIAKLQQGLDRCIKDRIGLKGEMQILKSALEVAHSEIKELRGNVKEDS